MLQRSARTSDKCICMQSDIKLILDLVEFSLLSDVICEVEFGKEIVRVCGH